MHQPPQGYFAPGADVVAQAKAVAELATLTGEFVKPKYFAYKASICAHARSRKVGCTACIDVCSTEAIRARRQRRRGRAAPVHGLRRVRDRVPVGRDDLCVPGDARPGRARAHAARDLRPRPAGATRRSSSTARRLARRSRASRAAVGDSPRA
jgi:ferredoxin